MDGEPQYDLFSPPKPSVLLTPSEMYELGGQDLLNALKEDRRIEKKPADYPPRELGEYFSMWANTPPDGGLMVLGMDNEGRVLAGYSTISQDRRNEIECTGNNYCPEARYETRVIPATRQDGQADSLLLIRVHYRKEKVVRTSKGEAFRRRGESKYRIPAHEIRELEIEKGEVDFEQEPIDLRFPDDFDMDLVTAWTLKVQEAAHFTQGHSVPEILQLRHLGKVTQEGFQANVACVLLFAKDPLLKFPGCKVRFLRFEGEFERTGDSFNAVKDLTIEGPIPLLISGTESILDSQLRTFSKLGPDGKFYTDQEYPKAAWYEAIVNACVHRSYNMKNMNIFVKMFDDHLVVESPGGFPPFVSPENIYEVSHPRNPHLMGAMFHFDYVKAANEGTRRMRDTMFQMNLPKPEFAQKESGYNTQVRVVLRNNAKQRRVWVYADVSKIVGHELSQQLTENEKMVVNWIGDHGEINVSQLQKLTGRSWHSAKNILKKMALKGILDWHHRTGLERDPNARYKLKRPNGENKA